MENTTKIGLNKTGIQMSPIDSKRLIQITQLTPPTLNLENNPTIMELRIQAVKESAQSIGSVPAPASLTGVVSTTLEKLSGNNPEILIDKLSERAAFERTGTRLYEALIAKAMGLNNLTSDQLAILYKIRDDEARHYRIVVDALESIGADPTAQTPCADLIAVASLGNVQVITDPRSTFAQSLNTLLTIELTDNAGWELLIDLADKLGHKQMVQSFRHALDQENLHLATIRDWLKQAVLEQA
ncbi:MAG: hypothetical protein K0R94_488 [Burkholderiales bacterium]|jgi:rubrerythrin|nr:hypothetical protein [Burkholderiales bacterium]